MDKAKYDRFLRGDHQALEELIGQYKETLTLYIYGYVKDITEAENLMIDTFAQMVVSRGQFKGKSSLKTYLFAIGRNEALRYLKKNRRHLSLEDVGEDCLSVSQDFGVFQQERNRQLYQAMAGLKQEYRQVLFLLYFEDMTYSEAGQVMKKSEKQITNLAYRGKKALREKLEAGGFAYYE